MGLRRFRELVDGAETLIFQAHPFRPGSGRAAPALIDGIEVHNANPRHNSRNRRAFVYAERHAKMGIAGSDAHKLEDVGRAGVALPARVASNRDFVRLLRKISPIDLRINDETSDCKSDCR